MLLMFQILIKYSSVCIVELKCFCVVIYFRLKMEVMKSNSSPLISMSQIFPDYELPALSQSIAVENILCVCVCVRSNDDWGKTTIQTEDVAITEEDLELIKERETAIRQLEVSFLFFCQHYLFFVFVFLPIQCQFKTKDSAHIYAN